MNAPYQFNSAETRLIKELENIEPFNLTLDEIGFFQQDKNLTVHIKTKDDSNLKKLFSAIKKTLPDVQIKHDEFHPHLTIAQVSNNGSQKQIDQFKLWLGDRFTFEVNKICILQRSKLDNTVPFHVKREILL